MKAWLLLIFVACHSADEPPRAKAGSGSAHHRSVVDEEIQRALVLDAALKKLETELADLEASPNRDEAAIAQKKQMEEALRSTLANTQRRIDELQGSNHSPR